MGMVTQDKSVFVEDDRTGLSVETLARAIKDNLYYTQAKDEYSATPYDWYMAVAYTVRDRLVHRWIQTQQTYYKVDAKRTYYLSAEYLMGRALKNNLIALGLYEKVRQALDDLGQSLEELLEQEPDAGLGNAGLGRLAACYLDSMATLGLPGYAYGIRYEFGIFEQMIQDGYQVEHPDRWLRYGNPWELPRPEFVLTVKFGGHTEGYTDEEGRYRVRWVGTRDLLGMPYDTPLPGYGNDTANTLRLWSARASSDFDLRYFDEGDYLKAVEEKALSENISKVLYPNDNSVQGKALRLEQQYFFVSCSIQDIMRRYLKSSTSFDSFPDKVAIQMNDTHPSIAIPELMRILVDDHGVPWEKAWDITRQVMSYTNHTLLPEALEHWPVTLFEELLPRHLEIIYEINRRFLESISRYYPGDTGRLEDLSLIREAPVKQVRMAHLAVVGSHAVNGVAALHTKLLRHRVFPHFNEIWPERFQSITNGVTPRRWLLASNPLLADAITRRIGPGWMTSLDELKKLEAAADDPEFRAEFRKLKRENKKALALFVREQYDLEVDVDSMFDMQVKRLHEYKRQHLNLLRIVALYKRIKRNPQIPITPRTFFFSGKSAPGYFLAKLIIKLINNVGEVVNRDPDVGGRLRVVFLPNYGVSLAQRIIPAADLSEQISTAGYEASGTGNMKFALNGALTIGTLDGANVEIREQVGSENFFLFGLTAEEVIDLKARGYTPYEYCHSIPELREVLDLVGSGYFSPDQPKLFQPLLDSLLPGGDPYMVLADFYAYMACQEEVEATFSDQDKWSRMAILNIARSSYFSSDRAVSEYADKVWHVQPVPIQLEPYIQQPHGQSCPLEGDRAPQKP